MENKGVENGTGYISDMCRNNKRKSHNIFGSDRNRSSVHNRFNRKGNMKEKAKEIQRNFSESMDTWANIVLGFEIKMDEEHIVPEKLDDETMMNATILFRHVLFNIGFHKRMINEENAAALGNELADLIKKYGGIDTRTYYQLKYYGFNPN